MVLSSSPKNANVTPRPKRVYGMCNRMCTKGFLNYFSAIIEFLKVILRVTLYSFQRIVALLQLRKVLEWNSNYGIL